MSIHETTASIVLLYVSFCSHNFPVKSVVSLSSKDKEKPYVGRCKSNISKHKRIESYSSPQHAPTCGIIHVGDSKLSSHLATRVLFFFNVTFHHGEWSQSRKSGTQLCHFP